MNRLPARTSSNLNMSPDSQIASGTDTYEAIGLGRGTLVVLIGFCILKLALHLVADAHSGFQGDELLHIETGNHLAFGYMEFPPMIGVLAFIQNTFQSTSVFTHHLFAHAASILILILVTLITVELGGKTKAVFLVLLCILIAPAFGRSQQLFQPVVFSQLFWVLNFLLLTKYVKYLDPKTLRYLAVTAALAFLTKYDAVFFLFGVTSLLMFAPTRSSLLKHRFWSHILLFLALISPNLIWQMVNGFPVLDMVDRLYETQLDGLDPLDVFQGLVIALNPLTLLVSIPAMVAMVHPSMRAFRPLSVSILLSSLLLAFSQGKGYYFYPLILTVLPFGAVFWERQIMPKRGWLVYPLGAVLSTGVFLIPFGLPVFPLDSYLKHDYPYENREALPGGEFNVRFEERYSAGKWSETMTGLKAVYDSLPEPERRNTRIWGKHYAQAGAVNLFHGQYGLPKAFSLHGSFFNWLPTGDMPETTICLGYDVGGFFTGYFDEVTTVRTIRNPYADDLEELLQHIHICKGPRQTFDGLKTLFADRVFE